MHRQNKAIVLALLAVLLWSTVAVPFKYGLKYFHIIHFLFISTSVAVLVLFVNLLLNKKMGQLLLIDKRDWLKGMLGGFLNPFLYYLMLFKAYSILPAQIAQALNYTWPIMLVLLSVPILGQKPNLNSVISLLLGFVGVYLIASEGQPWPLAPSEPLGVVLAILTSVVWALFWLLNARSKVDPSISLFLNFLSGWFMLLLVLIFVPFNYKVPKMAWFAVFYAGVFEMGLTFIVWMAALRMALRTDHISNYVYLSPFLSLFFIYLILHENIYNTTIIGLFVIVFSVLLKHYNKGKRK